MLCACLSVFVRNGASKLCGNCVHTYPMCVYVGVAGYGGIDV